MSSLRVQKGYKVKLYEHHHFEGRCVSFSAGAHGMNELISTGFQNDMLSSLIVEADNDIVVLYQHAGFGGSRFSYGMGYHDIETIRSTIGNDQVSSIYVKAGYTATLYEHEHFGGISASFGSGYHDLGAIRHRGFKNDLLSSMI